MNIAYIVLGTILAIGAIILIIAAAAAAAGMKM
jgi:hypothetical protein